MPGLQLLRSRVVAWTNETLVLASRADGRVIARWNRAPVPERAEDPDLQTDLEGLASVDEEETPPQVLESVTEWSALANPERLALRLVNADLLPGELLPYDSWIELIDPDTGARTRELPSHSAHNAICGWRPDGGAVFVSGRWHEPPALQAPADAIGLGEYAAADGRLLRTLAFDALPHSDGLVFAKDGTLALSRSLSQYRAHLAVLELHRDGLRVRASPWLETWRAIPLEGFREALVVEAGHLGARTLSVWNLETLEASARRVLFEISEEEAMQSLRAFEGRGDGIAEAWVAGNLALVSRAGGTLFTCPLEGGPLRPLPVRADAARVSVTAEAVFVANGREVQRVSLDDHAVVTVAAAEREITAIAADPSAGELVALLSDGSLRAFRIERA